MKLTPDRLAGVEKLSQQFNLGRTDVGAKPATNAQVQPCTFNLFKFVGVQQPSTSEVGA